MGNETNRPAEKSSDEQQGMSLPKLWLVWNNDETGEIGVAIMIGVDQHSVEHDQTAKQQQYLRCQAPSTASAEWCRRDA